jgi:hypothetical protein
MESLTIVSGSNGITVGQLREWLAGLPADMLIAMATDSEGNGFNVLVEAKPRVRYDLNEDTTVHECVEMCEAYKVNEREFCGLAPDSDEWVDCEYTWGGSSAQDSDVHVVMLWPAG